MCSPWPAEYHGDKTSKRRAGRRSFSQKCYELCCRLQCPPSLKEKQGGKWRQRKMSWKHFATRTMSKRDPDANGVVKSVTPSARRYHALYLKIENNATLRLLLTLLRCRHCHQRRGTPDLIMALSIDEAPVNQRCRCGSRVCPIRRCTASVSGQSRL